jgi:hypothetical protein
LFDINLPGVERMPGGDHGWKASGSPASKWIYTDKRPVAVSKGIKKVTVKSLARLGRPGDFAIFVNHKGGTVPLREPGQVPLRLTVELNDTALPPGGRQAAISAARRYSLRRSARSWLRTSHVSRSRR